MQQTQLLKGVLEGCVLILVAEEETYGYELVNRLRAAGFSEIIGGTVYPLLQKLETKGLLKSRVLPSPDGPDRKYYRLSDEGKIQIQAFTSQWENLTATVGNIIKNYEEMSGDE